MRSDARESPRAGSDRCGNVMPIARRTLSATPDGRPIIRSWSLGRPNMSGFVPGASFNWLTATEDYPLGAVRFTACRCGLVFDGQLRLARNPPAARPKPQAGSPQSHMLEQ